MRVFIAIDLPEDLRKKLVSYYSRLGRYVRGKFVEEENLHITLKFLGEQQPNIVEKVKKLLAEIRFERFTIKVKNLGAFPSLENPRVIWVGAYSDELIRLVNEINNKLKRLGFPLEQNFVGHITLVRAKFILDKKGLHEFARKFDFDYKFEAREFKLKRSILTPKGPIYSDLEAYPLI